MNAAALPLLHDAPVAHPDAELIARLVARDEVAFRRLFLDHHAEVFRLARRFVYGDAEAEEVAQEVFIAAFQNIARFRGGARLRTWLYRITVNRALKRRRWWGRRREAGAEALPQREDHGVGPEVHAAERQQLALLRACMEKLESRKRAVLVLHELEGLDTQEIADILECPRSTILTRLSRARADLIRMARRAGIDVPGEETG